MHKPFGPSLISAKCYMDFRDHSGGWRLRLPDATPMTRDSNSSAVTSSRSPVQEMEKVGPRLVNSVDDGHSSGHPWSVSD